MKRKKSLRLEVIKGEIERVTYVSPEDGYAVIRLKADNLKEPVTVTGIMGNVVPGEFIEAQGYWVFHEKYGRQFRVLSFNSLRPSSLEGLKKYLGSGLIKGIGPVIASRIVDHFGSETLDVIEHDMDRLQEVEGIGVYRLESIKKAWEEQRDIRDLMQFLQYHGISTSYAHKIFKCYEKEAIEVIKTNPYRLAMDIRGIGFITADKIARSIGIPENSILRAKGAIVYMLHELASDGHLCYPQDKLVELIYEKLQIPKEVLLSGVDELVSEETLIRDNEYLYLPGFYRCEIGAARKLIGLFVYPSILMDVDNAILEAEKQLPIVLDDKQKEALRVALTRRITIITGGPGTGKTTLIRAMVKAVKALGHEIVLCAPTGRASKRLEETTRIKASTIHRLLEYSPKEGRFQKNENNPVRASYFVVDEVSMLDLPLLYHLLKAIPYGASVVFIGDVDQLPSVGPGSVLRDLIRSDIFPVVTLNKVYRQARNSSIIVNAHRIREGKFPFRNDERDKISDFYFIHKKTVEDIPQLIVKLCTERIPERFGMDPFDDIQVLTPMHRGILGTQALNRLLQDVMNPDALQIERSGMRFRTGDKVMQIQNNYEKDVYNGDIGRIVFIDFENQELAVDFDGRRVSYDFSEIDELTLAYAISIHKAQGSEYKAVIIPVVTHHYVMLQRNLLYTAVTRGKKLVILIGTPKAMAIALRNTKLRERYSRFCQRLQEIAGGL